MSVVLVNPFEVPAGQEERFLADWQHAADWMRQQPGFLSSKLHQSLDPDAEFRFINVAEWESADHFRKAAASPEFQHGGAANPHLRCLQSDRYRPADLDARGGRLSSRLAGEWVGRPPPLGPLACTAPPPRTQLGGSS